MSLCRCSALRKILNGDDGVLQAGVCVPIGRPSEPGSKLEPCWVLSPGRAQLQALQHVSQQVLDASPVHRNQSVQVSETDHYTQHRYSEPQQDRHTHTDHSRQYTHSPNMQSHSKARNLNRQNLCQSQSKVERWYKILYAKHS